MLKSGGLSSVWWAKYYVSGKTVRESTKCEKEQDARRFLKLREGAVPLVPRFRHALIG